MRIPRIARALDRLGRLWPVSPPHGQEVAISASERGSSELLLRAMESAANAMFIADRKGRILWVNSAFTHLSGFAPGEVLGRTPRLLKSGRQSKAFYCELWQTILSGRTWRGRLMNRTKGGELYNVGQSISPIRDAAGTVTHFLAVHEDITEQLQLERRLVQEAMFDAETELPNRSLLRRRLVDAIARANRSGRVMAVLAVELTVGANGDERPAGLLTQVAGRLHAVLRQIDLLARTAESSFAIVVEDLGTPSLGVYPALRILESLAEPLTAAGGPVRVDARIGVAIYPGDGASPEILLKQAISAASAAGRRVTSRVCFVDRAIGVTAARLARW